MKSVVRNQWWLKQLCRTNHYVMKNNRTWHNIIHVKEICSSFNQDYNSKTSPKTILQMTSLGLLNTLKTSGVVSDDLLLLQVLTNLPELTPGEANERGAWSRAAVATQTAAYQPITGLKHFLCTAWDERAKQQQRFHDALSSVINHGRVFYSQPSTSGAHGGIERSLHELTRKHAARLCLCIRPVYGPHHNAAVCSAINLDV